MVMMMKMRAKTGMAMIMPARIRSCKESSFVGISIPLVFKLLIYLSSIQDRTVIRPWITSAPVGFSSFTAIDSAMIRISTYCNINCYWRITATQI